MTTQNYCPCENNQPDPCPKCGATVASGVCAALSAPSAVPTDDELTAARVAELHRLQREMREWLLSHNTITPLDIIKLIDARLSRLAHQEGT